ncbi:MAG: A-macroglobulin complement component [Candidatus Melainabacteria bacterium]|nr:A-macroglobulin complement component [Candidatus Melainabacteria bacterium]
MSRTRLGIFVLTSCTTVLSMFAIASSQATVTSGNNKAESKHKDVKKGNQKQVTAETLGGTSRLQTFLSCDKPIYKGGETIYIRGVMLNANDHKPLPASEIVNASVQIRGPKGEVVSGGLTSVQDSVWTYSWQVPDGQAGGEYKILASYIGDGYAPAKRKFEIRAYRAPRLNSQIKFQRDGYGPGEKVTATLEVKRAEGGVPSGAKVTVNARVDGIEIPAESGTVDATGHCTVSFLLPSSIPHGEGTLALIVQDGGVVETASKSIPILLQSLDLQMYPEGGDLVAGCKNRVYVQAFQPNGKPADLVANIVADDSRSHNVHVAQFRTEHEGRGRFEFTPDAKKKYSLRVLKPAKLKQTVYPLPQVKADGAVIHSDQNIYKNGTAITLQVGCTAKKFRVSVSKREKELFSRTVEPSKAELAKNNNLTAVTLPIKSDADGVLTVNVWDKDGEPLAERIIFREPSKPLNITIKSDKQSYAPGDSAKVTVKATDAKGNPVAAVVGVTVTDESVLQMVEKREQAPQLPVMILLEPEVKDLADAHVYLDQKNPKAALATDLLLGTQGWRRFAFVDVDKFMLAGGDDARRVLAFREENTTYYGSGRRGWAGVPTGAAGGVAIGAPLGFDVNEKAARRPRPLRFKEGQVQQLASADKAASIVPPGRVEGPRDVNMFQVEPSALDERHFSEGREERKQVQQQGGPGARFKFAPNVWKNEEAQKPQEFGMMVGDRQDVAIAGKVLHRMNQRARRVDSRWGRMGQAQVMVREFAHKVRDGRQKGDREDFAETLYWNAAIKTNAHTGEGTINFGLNDSVTTFKVFADGFTTSGAIGGAASDLKSIIPFYAEAKLPLEVTAGDRLLLPISLVNGTNAILTAGSLHIDLPTPFKLEPLMKRVQQLMAGQRARSIQPISVGFGNGAKEFVLKTNAGQYSDKVTRKLIVKPKGFPVEKAFGGILEPNKPVKLKVTIEKNVVPESMTSAAAIYPSPLANLTGALERLIQDPCGCFEQTSSTSYPLTMAQQYFQSHTGVDPQLVQRSSEKLEDGYKKLVSFWCPDRGYEWFGQDPGHEALTAFGLLHFTDMSKVRQVDQSMIATTRSWLMKQKDGKGGFNRNRRGLHRWIEDKDCSNAYIVWALLESGQTADDLKQELESLKTASNASKDGYVLALAANAFELAGDKAHAKTLMQRLVAVQKTDGGLDGAMNSIVGSGGEALQIEGAALATLAWLREPEFAGNVEKSIKFLADSCKAGRYGSTQSTVLALRAITTYDKQRAVPKAPGKVRLYVDGQPIGDWVAFDRTSQESIKLPDPTELLTPGEHELEVRMEGGSPMPYALAIKYNTNTPVSSKDCNLDLSVKLAQNKVVEGASTEANVTVTNTSKDAVPTPVAIVGIPGGMEPRHAQLKELVKKGTIDSYEVLGRDVVLYWRSMPGNAKVQIPLSLIAAVPGTYTGPASRAYLYYTDEHKKWVDGVKVEIAAKN